MAAFNAARLLAGTDGAKRAFENGKEPLSPEATYATRVHSVIPSSVVDDTLEALTEAGIELQLCEPDDPECARAVRVACRHALAHYLDGLRDGDPRRLVLMRTSSLADLSRAR